MKRKAKKVLKWAKSVGAALRRNIASVIIVALQIVTIYRVEKLGDKIDALGMGVAQSLIILYMNIVLMMNEMAGILEKVLAIVMGDPA